MITALFNVSTNTVEITHPDDDIMNVTSVPLSIGFVSESTVTYFNDLSFGFSYFIDGIEAVTVTLPEPGHTFESTDQDFMVIESLPVVPQTECVLQVWCVNAGERVEGSNEWTTPNHTYEHVQPEELSTSIEELEEIANDS